MAVLKWDQPNEKLYETGVSKGVLYVHDGSNYGNGVAWNGLTHVNENPSGAETTKLYANNAKYLELQSAEEFGCTIEAYMRPDEFEECDGSAELATGITIGQQTRKSFGLCYRTEIGSDSSENYGYKIHIVYGCKAAPSSRDYQSINDNPEAITLSWEVTTTPIEVAGHKPTATLIIDSTKFSTEPLKAKLTKIEDELYGTSSKEPHLPTPAEILALINSAS